MDNLTQQVQGLTISQENTQEVAQNPADGYGLETKTQPNMVNDVSQENQEANLNSSGSPKQESPVTPKQDDQDENSPEIEDDESSPPKAQINVHQRSKYSRPVGDDGKKKKNFYNPPQKVMRQMAQQQYFDNMYGNQGQFYQLKQKYKTQMCKHFLNSGTCPLEQYCQFAHGPGELRQSNDPLPANFGKTALGAVHSNYKTMPCKNFFDSGECKFGEACSFFHDEKEKRSLIDPLPKIPEGVTLPPMPEKLKNYKEKKARGYYDRHDNMNSHQVPQFIPQMPMQQMMIPMQDLTQIMAFSGFNPNKYLSPQPMPVQPVYYQNVGPNYQQLPPHMMPQQVQMYGNPQNFNGQQMPQAQQQYGTTPLKPQKQNSYQGDKRADKKEKKTKLSNNSKSAKHESSPQKVGAQ